MALYSRLCSNKHFTTAALGLYRSNVLTPFKLPSIQWMKVTSIQSSAALTESHDAKNARLNRPQSPHLSIYAFPLPAVLSITHRMTGAALAGYTMIFGIGALYCNDFDSVINAINLWELSPVTVMAGKSMLALPFAYHLVNGIRHLVWDMGKFLTIPEVYTTGYVMLGVSGLLTAALLAM